MDKGHWVYNSEFYPEDYIGFIYRITCNSTGKFYIGRKAFFSLKTLPPLRGYVRKRKTITESNWKEYTSSSVELNNMIGKSGIGSFQFHILRLCSSKSEMSFYEVYHIIHSDSMLSPLGMNKNCSKVPCRPKVNNQVQ